MNVEAPTAGGSDVIDSTGLELITAAVPINGAMEFELEVVATRRFDNDLSNPAPLSEERNDCVAVGSEIIAG
ncbi:hypothetical protein RLW55_07310 [Hyphomicrobium sp. B1]|jgi:hypothetical protein|uniref:hypothetical protein n=1 Tax=unclassified Hyphomicrobium TaxID=2619925 RepID=UPI00391A6D96